MPEFAELALDTTVCPNCKQQTRIPGGLVKFQWGKIPHSYKVGDKIVWLIDKQGKLIPPFTIVDKKTMFGLNIEWNCGESRYQNLYVFDTDPNLTQFRCSECETLIDTIVIEVQNGKINPVQAFRETDLQSELGIVGKRADIIIIQDDGSLWSRFDWDDVTLS